MLERFAALGALLVALTAPAALAEGKTTQPNIVVFYVDDLGYGDLGIYGSPVIRTPRIDGFAAEGARFTAFYAPAPNCSPSRAGLLTGRTPSRVGLYDIVLNRESTMGLPESEITVAELLRKAGYDTFHGGKWHLTPERNGVKRSALRHGFDVTTPPGILAHGIVDHLDRYLESRPNKTKPFFAYLAIPEPHEPVGQRVRPEFRAPYENAETLAAAKELPYGRVPRPRVQWDNASAYFGLVAQIDDAFGKLLDVLDKRGLGDNTFLFFASDNGPDARSRYAFGSPGLLRGAKGQVYEGGIRTPAILRYPGKTKPGTVVDEPINGTDFLPTACAVAGIAPPADRKLDGVNFLPVLEGKPLVRPVPMYWSMWAGRGGMQYAMRDGDWKILGATEPLGADETVIAHIKTDGFVGFELYNLKADPYEIRDLSTSEPERFAAMKQRFLELHREIIAEGPDVSLEEHRGKARAAFGRQATDDDDAEDEGDGD